MQLPKPGLGQKLGPSLFSSGKYSPLSFISKRLQKLHTLECSAAGRETAPAMLKYPLEPWLPGSEHHLLNDSFPARWFCPRPSGSNNTLLQHCLPCRSLAVTAVPRFIHTVLCVFHVWPEDAFPVLKSESTCHLG